MHFLRFFIVCSLFISGCASLPQGNYVDSDMEPEDDKRLVIWMLSDIQPQTVQERIFFENAIEDVQANVEKIDMAVMAGDLLKSRSKSEAYIWFLNTRERAGLTHWYEIAGNHDVRSGDVFQHYFPVPTHYEVVVGNVLLLLLSDQSVASKTEISEESFNWWADKVRANQDKIIITVSHAQLRNSGLLGSMIKSRRIAGSLRFEEVLRQERVAFWASGHSHLPQSLSGTVALGKSFNNICFVNVSSIGEGSLMDSQSRFFEFTDGSDIVWLRSRNHTKRAFNQNLDFKLKMEKPFSWDGGAPQKLLPF